MKKRKATVTTPVRELTGNESIEHYNAIMIEEIRSVVRSELEGIHARMDAFENKLESFRIEVNGRFNVVEAAIRCNADAIRELRVDVNRLKNEMTEVKGILNHVANRVDDHEERVGRMERVS